MTNRDAVRREVVAELVAFADRKAWGHWEAMEQAREHGKDDMADRCGHLVSAWRQVETELRQQYLDGPDLNRGEVDSGQDAGTSISHRAHRVAYEALVGPIPDGLGLDHLCRVRQRSVDVATPNNPYSGWA